MPYQLLADDGAPLDAHFEVDGSTVVFHSRGGTKGKGARNVDYSAALRLLLQRLKDANHPIQSAWVDSNRVQSIPVANRIILYSNDIAASSADQVSRMAFRMQAIGRASASKSERGNATKRIRLQLGADVISSGALKALRPIPVNRHFRSEERLPVSELEKVTAEHLFASIQRLRGGEAHHGFGESTDYDVLLEDDTRLAPKAVFGLAASEALGFQVGPQHFVGGMGSPSFRILESAGYQVAAKREAAVSPTALDHADSDWQEGTPKLREHLRRERSASIREAKKAEFRRRHGGRLLCERCKEDPVEKYRTKDAEACIEVHHARLQISEMQDGHKTRLEDLQCLCANCHRLAHREMRTAITARIEDG